jgi:hypothetical protein
MRFNPKIHTKEYLLLNNYELSELCESSVAFAKSNLAFDNDILKKVVEFKSGKTAAHLLAIYQPDWDVNRLKAELYEVFKLTETSSMSVAHWLSLKKNHFWIASDANQDPDILRLTNAHGVSVALSMARNNPQWMDTEASKNIELLSMQSHLQKSVAHGILDHDNSIFHEPLMHKRILTLTCDGKLLAESFVEKHKKMHGIDTTTIAMKLISQGAAYKHSKLLQTKTAEEIINLTAELISECTEPAVSLKYSIALYSTINHAVEMVAKTSLSRGIGKLQNLLNTTEKLITDLLIANPSLEHLPINADIYCEAGEAFVKRCLTIQNLDSLNDSLSSLSIDLENHDNLNCKSVY